MRELDELGKIDTEAWLAAAPLTLSPDRDRNCWVNDVVSGITPTRMARVVSPGNLHEARRVVRRALANGETLSIAGGRTSSGGTSFASQAVLVSTTHLNRVLEFDAVRGRVEVEAGVRWSSLCSLLEAHGRHELSDLDLPRAATVGGALSRDSLDGDSLAEFVESLTYVDPTGVVHTVEEAGVSS